MADNVFFSSLYGGWCKNRETESVWMKGTIVPGYDPAIWRKDTYGWWMKRSEYGNCSHEFGWEVDHIWPLGLFGSDEFSNKQPLHWQNNRRKGDKVPSGLGGLYGL